MIPMNEGTYDNLCYYVTRGLHDYAGVLIDTAEPAKVRAFFERNNI